MILTYRYRLLPTKGQRETLDKILEDQRQLYNAALEERIAYYRVTGRSRTLYDQQKALTECRSQLPEMAALPVRQQRATLTRLDEAYKAFFRRLKAGQKSGFPRFKGRGWFDSFGFAEFSGITFDGKRVRFNGLRGGLRVHVHRPFPNNSIRSCTFRRDAKGWQIAFHLEVEPSSDRAVIRSIGLDVGLSSLVVGSDGLIIPNPRIAKKSERSIRITQRCLARAKRGSKRRSKTRRRLAKLHKKIRNTRETFLHQASAAIVGNYDLIAVENLNVRGLASGMLARSVNDAAWGKLLFMLRYKAERAGAKLIDVDPRNTTQECSGCGEIVRKELADRLHACTQCGTVLDRDENAARVILQRAVSGPSGVNVARQSERCPRKTDCEDIRSSDDTFQIVQANEVAAVRIT